MKKFATITLGTAITLQGEVVSEQRITTPSGEMVVQKLDIGRKDLVEKIQKQDKSH